MPKRLVLWNSYGASTTVCPEPTSTAFKLTSREYLVIPQRPVLKPLGISPMTWWRLGGRIKSLLQATGIRLGITRKSLVDDRGGYRCDMCRHVSHLPEPAVLRESRSRAYAKRATSSHASHALVCRDARVLCTLCRNRYASKYFQDSPRHGGNTLQCRWYPLKEQMSRGKQCQSRGYRDTID